MKDNSYHTLIFFILLIIGLLLRIWFARLSISIPIYDQLDYLKLADNLTTGKWGINCCTRSFGYPFLLASIFNIFGKHLMIIYVLQIILEMMTAIILYLTANLVYRNSKISLIVFATYILNPFTASYVGMILTEIWAFFLLSLLLYLVIFMNSYPRYKNFVLFICGIIVGFYVYSRIAFFWWGMLMVFGLPFFTYLPNKKKIIKGFLFIICGFLLIAQYQMRANFALYKTWSPTTARPGYVIDMYWNTLMPIRPTLLVEIFKATKGKSRENQAYLRAMETPDYKKTSTLYFDRVMKYISDDPGRYLMQRLTNISILWHKRNLFYYTDPFMPYIRPFTGILNVLFLGISFIGIFINIKNINNKRIKMIFIFIVLSLILYMTTVFSLFVPEDRLTLVAYPFLSITFGFGIYYLNNLIRLIIPEISKFLN
jgi:hypothetical protein